MSHWVSQSPSGVEEGRCLSLHWLITFQGVGFVPWGWGKVGASLGWSITLPELGDVRIEMWLEGCLVILFKLIYPVIVIQYA